MAATPGSVPNSNDNALLKRLVALEKRLDAIANKTLSSASITSGGLTIDGGSITLKGSGDINMPAGGHIRDGQGNIIFSADAGSGERLSTPFLPIPLYPEFGNRTTGLGFMTCLASDIGTTEKQIWEGVIPQVVAPLVMWKFLGGDASSNLVTVTYRLYVNSNLVDSFSANSTFVHQTSEFDGLDITEITTFGTTNVPITITAQCSVSNADQVFCQLLSAAQCGR